MDEVRLVAADVVVCSSDRVVADGAIAFKGHRIAAVGTREDLRDTFPGAECVVLRDRAILPSFVNAHAHLCLSHLAGAAPYDGNFAAWLQTVLHAILEWTEEDHANSLAEGLQQSIARGTGAVADILNDWSAVPAYERLPIGGTVFLQVTGFNPVVADVWMHNLEQAFASLPDGADLGNLNLGISPHAPYSTSAKLYRECFRFAEKHDLLLTTHLAETTSEEDFLRNGTGVYRRMLRERGTWVPRWKPPDMTPVEYFEEEGVLTDRCLYAHVNYPSDSDIDLLAKRNITAVYCPGSHAFFHHKPHRMDEMVKAGIRVALGTDSLASNHSIGMLEEVKLCRERFPHMPAETIFDAGTIRGAEGLRVTDAYGTLEVGKKASFIVADMGEPVDPSRTIEQLLSPGSTLDGSYAWGMPIPR